MTGAAYVGWDGTYSFNVTGRGIPVEIAATRCTIPQAPAVGPARLHRRRQRHVRVAALRRASSASTTCSSATKASAQSRRGSALRGQHAERRARRGVAAARRLGHRPHRADAGGGRRADVPRSPTRRSTRTSALFQPKLSPFTTAVASGTMRVVGELRDLEHLAGRAQRRRARPAAVRLRGAATTARCASRSISRSSASTQLRLVGEGTRLDVGGTRRPRRRARSRCRRPATPTSASCRGSSATSAARAGRPARRDHRPAGRRRCSRAAPTIADGRIRHFSLPHALEAINGSIRVRRHAASALDD